MPKPRAQAPSGPVPTEDGLLERLRSHLEFLGLTHTLELLEQHLEWAVQNNPGHTAVLEHVLAQEVEHKSDKRLQNRLRSSGLMEVKTLEGFDWDFQKALDKNLIMEHYRLEFIRRKDDFVMTGQSGTGKSHILKAFGVRACQLGISVRYARCIDLLDDLHASLADGTYPQKLRGWARPDLLIIDDVGLGQVKKRDDEPTAAHTLFNLIDRRHGKSSTAITSNIKLSEWGKYLGDATVVAAILDRLAMNAIRIDLNGPSYRQYHASLRAGKTPTKGLSEKE